MSRRVIVIGLDGATMDLIRPWVHEGRLPHLGRLMREGVSGELRSTVPPVTGPAWISFMTGKNPANHGVFHFRTFDLARYTCYDETLVTSTRFANDTIFKLVSDAGLRVAALAVPMTFPPFPVNGIMLSGYPTPNLQTAYAYPPEMSNRFSNINITSEFFRHSDQERVRSATHMVEQLTTYCVELMQEEQYDLFMVVFTNTDMANHFFRKYTDPDYPAYDPEGAQVYGTVLRDQYVLADEAVGRLVEQADDDTTIIIMSDHGSGVHPTRYLHTNSWLRSKGWLEIRGGLATTGAKGIRTILEYARMKAPWARDFVKRRFPSPVKAGISSGLHATSAIRWSQTKAYRVPMFFFVEGIEVNLKGRQPQGIVEPGPEYEELRDQIIAELKGLADPTTGELIVRRAFKKEEEYSGPFMHNAPDIVVFYDHDYAGGPSPVGPVTTPIERYTLNTWSGQHRMNGTLIMWGKDVPENLVIEGASIVDPAPTIMYLLDLPIPAEMDGRVLTEALDPALLAARPVTIYHKAEGEKPEEAETYVDEEEEEQIREALRGLGYID